MAARPTLLKVLLTNRHLQSHRAFCREFDKVARSIDRTWVATAPSREQFFRWLGGRVKTRPSADHCRVLERMFPGHRVAELLAPYDPEIPDPGMCDAPSTTEEAATKRRQVMRFGAATVAAGLADSVIHGPDLLQQVLDTTSVGEGRLDLLETQADRLGERLDKAPPISLLPEATLCMSSVRDLLAQRQPVAAQRQLARTGAKLAILIGQIMFNHDRFPLARRWYDAALRAAEEAGDRYLADLALASMSLIPTYAGDPAAVLAHVTPRLERQGAVANPALAWMWGFAALAHASLGDRDAFERAINRSRSTLDRCSPDLLVAGCLSFLPERQAFYEARGLSDLGDATRAGEAASRALAATDPTDTTDPALVRFAYACALAKSGEAEEACNVAATALRAPHVVHTVPVVVRAYEFDALLDPKLPATRDWREVLTQVRTPDAIPL
jgi:tetratricopeptide (TPR) repeat protein